MSSCLNNNNKYVGFKRKECEGPQFFVMEFKDGTVITDPDLTTQATCPEIITFQGLANSN